MSVPDPLGGRGYKKSVISAMDVGKCCPERLLLPSTAVPALPKLGGMSTSIGTPFSDTATRVLLCGSGELGKEVVIELQRYGVEVIAVDAYENAPAMQVADRSHVIPMHS